MSAFSDIFSTALLCTVGPQEKVDYLQLMSGAEIFEMESLCPRLSTGLAAGTGLSRYKKMGKLQLQRKFAGVCCPRKQGL